jgi:D-alanine-D-alanine ligase
MRTVGVLFGGRSGEHDVSLCSAASVVSALDPAKYRVVAIGIDRDGKWYPQGRAEIVDHPDFGRILKMEKKGVWHLNHYEDENRLVLSNALDGDRVAVDVVFPAVHGTYCEDGNLQGLLELAMVPYVGADTVGSSIGIDKDVAKRLLRDGKIPVVPWITITDDEWRSERGLILDGIRRDLPLPFFIKPARTGSSVGVIKARDYESIPEGIDEAFRYDTKILVERGIDAREIECAVIGNADPEASVLGEVVPRHEFYSYESKYIDPDGAELLIPAPLDEALAERIREAALRGYRLLCCGGMARVDFFLDRQSGEFYLNEVNTLPGFTGISMYPRLWEHSGLPYPALIDRLIELAFARHRARAAVLTHR